MGNYQETIFYTKTASALKSIPKNSVENLIFNTFSPILRIRQVNERNLQKVTRIR
jgi:hypothetical protein